MTHGGGAPSTPFPRGGSATGGLGFVRGGGRAPSSATGGGGGGLRVGREHGHACWSPPPPPVGARSPAGAHGRARSARRRRSTRRHTHLLPALPPPPPAAAPVSGGAPPARPAGTCRLAYGRKRPTHRGDARGSGRRPQLGARARRVRQSGALSGGRPWGTRLPCCGRELLSDPVWRRGQASQSAHVRRVCARADRRRRSVAAPANAPQASRPRPCGTAAPSALFFVAPLVERRGGSDPRISCP